MNTNRRGFLSGIFGLAAVPVITNTSVLASAPGLEPISASAARANLGLSLLDAADTYVSDFSPLRMTTVMREWCGEDLCGES